MRQSSQHDNQYPEVTDTPFYSESNMRELERRARDMDAHRNVSEHELLEAEEHT